MAVRTGNRSEWEGVSAMSIMPTLGKPLCGRIYSVEKSLQPHTLSPTMKSSHPRYSFIAIVFSRLILKWDHGGAA